MEHGEQSAPGPWGSDTSLCTELADEGREGGFPVVEKGFEVLRTEAMNIFRGACHNSKGVSTKP